MTERLYVDTLPFDLSTYEIERIELQEVAIDLDGGVEVSLVELTQIAWFRLGCLTLSIRSAFCTSFTAWI